MVHFFSFLESRRTAFLPHPQNMQAKANGMFDVQSRVITYDEDEQIDAVLLDTLQKQKQEKKEHQRQNRGDHRWRGVCIRPSVVSPGRGGEGKEPSAHQK